METCRCCLVLGVILLGLCSNVIAEGTFEPLDNDRPMVDGAGLDPTLDVQDPDDLDKSDKSAGLLDDVLQGTGSVKDIEESVDNQIPHDTKAVQNVNEDTVDSEIETPDTNNFEKSEDVGDSVNEKVKENESVNENADLDDKIKEESKNNDTEVENAVNIGVKNEINGDSSIKNAENSDVKNEVNVDSSIKNAENSDVKDEINGDSSIKNAENSDVKNEVNVDSSIKNAENSDAQDEINGDSSNKNAENSDLKNEVNVDSSIKNAENSDVKDEINGDSSIKNAENSDVKDKINEDSGITDTEIKDAINESIDLTDEHRDDDDITHTEIENVKAKTDTVQGIDVENTEVVNTGLDEFETDADNGYVKIDEKETGLNTGNVNSPITDNSHLIEYEKDDGADEESQTDGDDDGHINLDDKKHGMETGNEAWFKESETDSDTTTVADISSTSTSSLWLFDENKESGTDDEYDYDDEDYEYDDDEGIWADSKDDETIWADDDDDIWANYDDNDDEDIWADSKDDETNWASDDDSSSEENEEGTVEDKVDWWKKMVDMDDSLTTTESWSTSTGGDYEWSDSMDEGNQDLKEVNAGKNMMESPHHFDNNAGVFAGAKVFEEDKVMDRNDRTFYSWTMLLSFCLVVTLFFIFWNRHKVERYIVSLRRPMNGHVRQLGDEEKNLLRNEYA